MHSLKVLITALFLCIVALAGTGVQARADDSTVVEIDGTGYSAADARNWWLNWRDEGMAVPATPDPYIDWLLFVHEAERMALFDDPQYQHDVNVYLKVISLVNLKNEEIDSKVDYSEEKLWQFYEEQFSPKRLVNVLIFKDQESAEKTRADLAAGRVTIADMVKIAGERSKQEQAQNPHGDSTIDVTALKQLSGSGEHLLGVQEKVVKRPYATEQSWRQAITGLDKGDFSQPFAWQGSYVVLNLADTVAGDKEEFAKMQSDVRNRYRKYREAALTVALIEKLKKKYAVQIDQERINALDPAAPPAEFSDAPVITFSTMTVSEKQLMEKVSQDVEFNKQYGFKAEEIGSLVKRVVEGVVSQTLITLESLDRHYERKSPTKEVFEFYQRNRLVKMLDEQIRSQGEEVSDQDIATYYQEHHDDFVKPHMYRMAVIEGDEKELKKIWLDVEVNKKDVMVVAEERLGHKPLVQSYPSNHLAPEVKSRAQALATGDLSQVFPSGKGFAMLYMVESIPPQTARLEDNKDKIAEKLRQERYAAAKDSYLKALREKAKIDINGKAWDQLRKELVKDNEKK